MTILERIRPERRPIKFGRIAKDLMNRDQVKDIREAASDAIEAVQQFAADAAERAGDAVGDAVDSFGSEASKTSANVARDVARVARDVQLDKQVDQGLDKVDGRVDDLVDRIRQALPTERITTLVTNLERELPSTDKDRYDRAFGRGFARARTSFVVIGAATGIAAGIAGAFLLDPQRGPERRNALRARLRSTTDDVTSQVRRTATVTADRARGFAYERGLMKPGGDTEDVFGQAPLVPVMDSAIAGGEPVMPLGDGPVTDPASIEREPMTVPDGGLIGGMSADDLHSNGPNDGARLSVDANAVTASLEPEAADATLIGDEADRGTWHRTM